MTAPTTEARRHGPSFSRGRGKPEQAGGHQRRGHGHVVVEELDASQYERWSRFVRESPWGSPYSLPAYLDALSTAGGGSFAILAALRGDEIAGGIAVYDRWSPAGAYVAPRHLLYYNGIVLREYATRYPSVRATRHVEATAALADALAKRGYGRCEIRSRNLTDARPLLDRGWRVWPSYSYVVSLTDLESQWGRVEENRRRLVERGRENGLTVAVDEDFSAFYRLHAGMADRKGAPLYLRPEAFRQLYETLRGQGLCRLYHARLPDGRVAASQLVLLGHEVSHTAAAAADPELQSTGANAFLRWSALEDLATLGHTANDLTGGALDSIDHFKSGFGGSLQLSLAAAARMTTRFRAQYTVYRWAQKPRAHVRARSPGPRSGRQRAVLSLDRGVASLPRDLDVLETCPTSGLQAFRPQAPPAFLRPQPALNGCSRSSRVSTRCSIRSPLTGPGRFWTSTARSSG
ncbi:MAG: GNAT family N-acetyltransferase [Gaiellaceae bacterium]